MRRGNESNQLGLAGDGLPPRNGCVVGGPQHLFDHQPPREWPINARGRVPMPYPAICSKALSANSYSVISLSAHWPGRRCRTPMCGCSPREFPAPASTARLRRNLPKMSTSRADPPPSHARKSGRPPDPPPRQGCRNAAFHSPPASLIAVMNAAHIVDPIMVPLPFLPLRSVWSRRGFCQGVNHAAPFRHTPPLGGAFSAGRAVDKGPGGGYIRADLGGLRAA